MARKATPGPLAAALLAAEAHHRINQKTAAARIGVGAPTYNRWVKGRNLPDIVGRAKLATYLDLDVAEVEALYPPDHSIHTGPRVFDPVAFDALVAEVKSLKADVAELQRDR